MKTNIRRFLALTLCFLCPLSLVAQEKPAAPPGSRPPAARTEAMAVLPQSGNYVLSQSDVIAVRVFREADLDTQCRISKDGTINFPLLGVVNVAGRTANEAATYLAKLLDKDYIINPQVSVSVVAYVKQKFNVLGQVGNAGNFAMPEEQTLDLLSAVAAAGGFTRLADQSKVVIKRQVNGKPQTFTEDARTYAKEGAKPFMILPNDTIIVPEKFF